MPNPDKSEGYWLNWFDIGNTFIIEAQPN